MRTTLAIGGILTAIILLAADPATKTISLVDLRDKIEGGWAGQMIGVSFGAPTEFRYRRRSSTVISLSGGPSESPIHSIRTISTST